MLAKHCDHGAMTDEMIRDRLVVGIRDAQLSQQLQIDADLTLEKAKKKIHQREAVAEQQQILTGMAGEASSVDGVRSRRGWQQPRAAYTARPKPKLSSSKDKTCTRCGKGPHPRDKCPAKDATCHRCQKKGHYSSQCFTKQVSEVASGNHLETAFLDTLSANQTPSWFTRIRANGCETTFKLNTGAEVTAIATKTYQHLERPQLSPASRIL